MKFWLATANLKRTEECLAYGVFQGVITNPHVVALENASPFLSPIGQDRPAAYYQLHAGTVEDMLKKRIKCCP